MLACATRPVGYCDEFLQCLRQGKARNRIGLTRLPNAMHNFTLLLVLFGVLSSAQAQVPALYAGADLALGDKLIAEHKCTVCHQQKVGGDGSAIYKPAGRINSPGLLRGMVEQCSLNLNLALFPDEVTAIAAALNRDHYRLK